jgi:signal transduction histidine kinase
MEKKIDIQEHEIPEPLKMAIYRIMQEGMTNITKHSGASLVFLSFRKRDSRIELVVQDNGRGFDLQEAHSSEDSRRGLGLVSMRERAEHSGGSFSIESAKGGGTVLRATWPL